MPSQTHPNLGPLRERLAQCMIGDRHRLRRMLDRAAQGAAPLASVAAAVERSAALRRARENLRPSITYPGDLPVAARRDEIAAAITSNQVVVIAGETGSGKTTQIPKICLELGRGVAGMIGHTQPRRIAARTVAARVAQELGVPVGGVVGYKIRFGDKTGDRTLIKVMTDGILLAETQTDRFFEQYDTIIIDEAHERSLNIDFLLGYLKQLLPKRPDLKVIVTSATIDPERFARHFALGTPPLRGGPGSPALRGGPGSPALRGGAGEADVRDTQQGAPAPVIEVSGRTYPVDIRYRPLESEDPDEQDRDMEEAILHAVDELARIPPDGGPQDILVFLPGEREIRETAEALRKHHPPQTEILPLYARLSAAEQNRVFEPHKGRRLVLATNVAETSLTVPGIRYVVDTGVARISRYTAKTKVQRLPVEPVSQASARQRAGRCGRLASGVCIRLYSEQDFEQRPAFTDPEILRTNLASVILQMKALRLGDVEKFPFVQPPDARLIRDGYETLHELGAVDEKRNLTPLGSRLARLPIDPRLGRMILAAEAEGSLREVLIVAAALSVQDPRERPMEKQAEADAAHERFRDEESDFQSYLGLWAQFREQERKLSGSKLRKWCRENFLSYIRLREWHDIHQQLHTLVSEMGHHPNREPATYDQLHRALLTGLITSVGRKADTFEYAGTRGARFMIFPGSGLFKSGPKWLMAAEIVLTTRLYARTVARIQPQWLEELGSHLVERAYTDPVWDEERAEVAAYERVSLLGLELVARRRVHYGPVDPDASRDIFIHSGLVEGRYDPRAPFVRHNQRVEEEVEAIEAKLRARDPAAVARMKHAFFDRRIPRGVFSGRTFDAWRRQAERANPRLLFMAPADLLAKQVDDANPERFPDELPVGSASLPLEYRHDPGAPGDGVSLTIPVEALGEVDSARAEWLVPGMAAEKIAELIRTLPKAQRKHFGPAPSFADEVLAQRGFAAGPLIETISAKLEAEAGVRIPRDAWRPADLPQHLRMNFRVVDEHGRSLAEGRDLDAIRQRLGPEVERRLARMPLNGLARDNLLDWDFGDLPERVEITRRWGGGGRLRFHAWPALVDEEGRVAIRGFPSPGTARERHRGGLRRLFVIRAGEDLDHYTKGHPAVDRLALQYSKLGRASELRRQLLALIAERAFLADDPDLRTHVAFGQRLEEGRRRLGAVVAEVIRILDEVLTTHQAVALRLEAAHPPAWAPVIADVREQVGRLVHPGFAGETPWQWLPHLPRYLRAAALRLERLSGDGLDRDARSRAKAQAAWRAYEQRAADHAARGIEDPGLRLFRWAIEEYRVSLFAQELRTALPVSDRRMEALWAAVRG